MSVNEGRQPLSRVRAATTICRMTVCRRLTPGMYLSLSGRAFKTVFTES